MGYDEQQPLYDNVDQNNNSISFIINKTTRHLTSDVAESEWFSILAQIISSTLLFILIFGMSATVDVGHLQEQESPRLYSYLGFNELNLPC